MSIAIGLGLIVISIVIFFFTFLKLLRKETGIIYLLVLRLFAALLFFAGYSVLVVPSTITYGAYNAVQGSTITTYANYTVTYTLPLGTQSVVGWLTVVVVVVMIGSVGIDFVMRMQEKKG